MFHLCNRMQRRIKEALTQKCILIIFITLNKIYNDKQTGNIVKIRENKTEGEKNERILSKKKSQYRARFRKQIALLLHLTGNPT